MGQLGTDVVQNRSTFGTRRLKAIKPPGPIQEQHDNQMINKRVSVQVARGDYMGGVLTFLFYHVIPMNMVKIGGM